VYKILKSIKEKRHNGTQQIITEIENYTFSFSTSVSMQVQRIIKSQENRDEQNLLNYNLNDST